MPELNVWACPATLEERQRQYHRQKQREERKRLWTRPGTCGACFQADDHSRVGTTCRPLPLALPQSSAPGQGRLVSVSFLFEWRAWLGSPPNFWGEYSFSHQQKDPPVGCEMSISRKHKKLLVIKMPGEYSDKLHSNLLSSFHNLRKL